MTIVQETALTMFRALRATLVEEKRATTDLLIHPGLDVAIEYIDIAIKQIEKRST